SRSYMDVQDLAKRIRDTCIEAVLQAYEDAGVQGLCAEGQWEAAVDALRTVDLAPLLSELKEPLAD
ncbi:MAG TPA: acetyltransferase, partial [Candidatus Binatia bacterium]